MGDVLHHIIYQQKVERHLVHVGLNLLSIYVVDKTQRTSWCKHPQQLVRTSLVVLS